ncbi:MAG: KTSC domain-containing protein [Chitinophagaceae bacterium]
MLSSVIATMAYEPSKRSLEVVFVSGAIYQYKKVPAAVYELMQKAPSKGEFLNRCIKGNYAFKKIK